MDIAKLYFPNVEIRKMNENVRDEPKETKQENMKEDSQETEGNGESEVVNPE